MPTLIPTAPERWEEEGGEGESEGIDWEEWDERIVSHSDFELRLLCGGPQAVECPLFCEAQEMGMLVTLAVEDDALPAVRRAVWEPDEEPLPLAGLRIVANVRNR